MEKKLKYVQPRDLRIAKELLNAKTLETHNEVYFRFSRIFKKERDKLKIAFYESK